MSWWIEIASVFALLGTILGFFILLDALESWCTGVSFWDRRRFEPLPEAHPQYTPIRLDKINAKRHWAGRPPLTDADLRKAIADRKPEDVDLTAFLIGYATGVPIPSADGMGIVGAALSPAHHVEAPISPSANSDYGVSIDNGTTDGGSDIAGSSGGGDW